MDGMLSQEEINALLTGEIDSEESNSEEGNEGEQSLSNEEKDAIGEISNICMGTASTTLYSLVNQKVVITTPSVSISTWDEIAEEYEKPCVLINIAYKSGITGSNVLILKEDDVKVITDLMMSGDGTNLVDELTELHFSAICEAMNQMMGSSATSLSSMLNRKVDISLPLAKRLDMASETDEEVVGEFLNKSFVKVFFKMEIGDLVDSNIMQLYPIELAKELYSIFYAGMDEEPEPIVPPPVSQPVPEAASVPPPPPPQSAQSMEQQATGGMTMQQGMPYGGYSPPQQNVNAQPVQFQAFATGANPITQQENIDLIMDVPLDVTVELGRTSKSIKEILEFTQGTIIELDKIAGEPIDVLVNGKLVAKGEVVVIEENFGIRVTDIVK